MNPSLQAILGLGLLLGLAWLLTEDRRRVPWRTVAAGVLLCLALVLLLLKLPAAATVLAKANGLVDGLEAATRAGTGFVFGYLGGAPPPWVESAAGSSFVLAFRALPLVLVISALSALLFHWRVLPLIVHGFAALLRRTLGVGGAVGLSAAANVFVGMVEAPLVVRPYLARMSRGELFIVMNCGMATIAGTVLVLYASMLSPIIPEALSHLLVASFAATPMAIAVAAIMVPPVGVLDATPVKLEREDPNAVAAITRGTLEGLQLLLNVVAMLIVFVALVALVNALLALLPAVAGAPLTLERAFGWVFAPLAWACGVPWSEAAVAGQLLGKKTVLNELVAYAELARLPAEALSPRSRVLMIYALCGFANFGSLGIMLGGMSAMMPVERRAELAQLASRSVLAGLLSTCATAAVVALVI